MELPILYALTHPARLPDAGVRRFDPVAAGPLTFEPVRRDVFRALGAGHRGRARGRRSRRRCSTPPTRWRWPRFSRGGISFGRISEVIEGVLDAHTPAPATRPRGGARGRPLGARARRRLRATIVRSVVLTTVLSLIVVLGVLVFVHEAGHFVAAKWAGIYVHRFSLGPGLADPLAHVPAGRDRVLDLLASARRLREDGEPGGGHRQQRARGRTRRRRRCRRTGCSRRSRSGSG